MRRPSLANGRVRGRVAAGDVLEERPPKWVGVPDASRFADQIERRPGEIVFIARTEPEGGVVRAWGALGIARHPQGLWCARSLEALRGRDVVFLDNEPGSGFAWAAGDVEVLAGTVARVGFLVPEACRSESPPRDLVQCVALEGHRGGRGLAGLVREAQAQLVALPGPEEEDEGDWPALRRGWRPPVPAFPVDVFPERLARFVRGAGGPPDFAGLAVLVAAGAAAGRSVLLRLRADWCVAPALFGLNVGEPADGAWEALGAVLAPLREADRALRQAYQKALLESERSPKRERLAAPGCQAALVEDCAPEVLAAHLARNPRGVLVTRDEADEWLAGLRPGKGAKRRLWRAGLDGAALRLDPKRDAQGVAMHLDSPFLAFCANVVPARLQELELCGTDVLDRVLVAFPDPLPPVEWPGTGFSDDGRRAWGETVDWLRARTRMAEEVEFADDAQAAFAAWYNEQAKALGAPEADALRRGADEALRGFAARLALIVHLLHAASHPTRAPQEPLPPVSLPAVRAGLRLASYFRAHHRRARCEIGGGDGNRIAHAIVQWVRRTERTRFSVSELTARLRWIAEERDELEIALRLLSDQNAIRRVSGEGRSWKGGRPRSASYEVHPKLRKT